MTRALRQARVGSSRVARKNFRYEGEHEVNPQSVVQNKEINYLWRVRRIGVRIELYRDE